MSDMNWFDFYVGMLSGIVIAVVFCTWMAKREHREVMTLLDRCIGLTEKYKEVYERMKGD